MMGMASPRMRFLVRRYIPSCGQLLLVTFREGWIQVSRLTGIPQRRLDICIHQLYFVAACHGNKDQS